MYILCTCCYKILSSSFVTSLQDCLLISNENSQNHNLNEPPAPAQSSSPTSESPPSFDLWSYQEAVANVQIYR